MTSLDQQLLLVRAGAEAGARSVSRQRQAIDDAIARAVEQWEQACIGARSITDWFAWAWRVGSNAARRPDRRGFALRTDDDSLRAPAHTLRSGMAPEERDCLRAILAERTCSLRGRQYEVVMKLLEPQMSIHRASKELGMSRYCVRRSFRSALERFRAQSVPPTPSSSRSV